MRNRLIYTALLLFSFFNLFAQDLNPCGTLPVLDPWLISWQAQRDQMAFRSADTLYAGIQVHLVARNNGTGRFPPERLLDAFCRLNEDYGPAMVRFYFKNDWLLPNNTAWYDHNDIPAGIDMMLTNNVPDALNSYFVSDPAGNCGYNLPYAGVAIAHSCADPNEHTWTHEVGHALSLPHPFIGWEGTVYSYAVPTPDFQTYDYTYFHDTLETTVPAPLDTALVERYDGSNCGIAADLICDSRPDYLSYRWDCDAQGESLVTLKDQNGNNFKADGTLYMSYSNDVCSNRFTDDQIAALRANLLTEKAAWLSPGPPEPDITELPQLLSPAGGENTPSTNVSLHWSPVPGATHYVVQVARFNNYLIKNYNEVVTDTSFVAASLPPGYTYYWRVRPFNYWYTCTSFTSNESFFALPTSATQEQDGEAPFRCFPSTLTPGQPLYVEIPQEWLNKTAQCQVFDAAGRQVWAERITPSALRSTLDLSAKVLPAGLYRLVWTNSGSTRVASFMVQPE